MQILLEHLKSTKLNLLVLIPHKKDKFSPKSFPTKHNI